MAKQKPETPIKSAFRAFNVNVCERIRTLDLLVRSQTLYPAELHTLNVDRGHRLRWDPVYTWSAATKSLLNGATHLITLPQTLPLVKQSLILFFYRLYGVISILDIRNLYIILLCHLNEIPA